MSSADLYPTLFRDVEEKETAVSINDNSHIAMSEEFSILSLFAAAHEMAFWDGSLMPSRSSSVSCDVQR
jgi:hypothetical protein